MRGSNGCQNATIAGLTTRAVIDTHAFMGTRLGTGAAARVARACLQRAVQPVMGVALLAEYEGILARGEPQFPGPHCLDPTAFLKEVSVSQFGRRWALRNLGHRGAPRRGLPD